MKKTLFARTTALLLSIALLLPLMAQLPFSAFAAGANSDDRSEYSSSQSQESVYLDGVYYDIIKKTSYIGNRIYQLNLELTASLSKDEKPTRRTSAKNGYFTVETTGYYLLELWGGEGSRGGDNEYSGGLVVRRGGDGGNSGYVYAKVYLQAGQTLAYSIGTKGTKTLRYEEGGGVNGGGGEHGSVGSYEVGGGGGYSALFFFEAEEFNPSWLSSSGQWNMPRDARVSQYVMIAAGGGGGGAANGAFNNNYTSQETGRTYYADGGNGGNINNGVSMMLSGGTYPVEGYIFAGQNGSSSGNSTAFVGRGGTNVPGTSPSTQVGLYSATPGPNDWSGTHNIELAAGAGGTGNLRGGGGGAGYCGGSGGIMFGLMFAESIGGGGGGSSFLAKSVGGTDTVFGTALDADAKALLAGAGNCPSDVGGAFAYTYLGDGSGNTEDTVYLEQIKVSGSYSKYFDVLSITSTDAYGNENGEITYNAPTGAFTVNAASIDAAHNRKDGMLLNILLILTPKTDFLGGNMVPLLNNMSATITKTDTTRTITATKQNNTDYVNVPLLTEVVTNSVMTSLKEGDEPPVYKIADLYRADHADAISDFTYGRTRTWEYEFLTNLSKYTIYEGKGGAVGSPYTAANTPPLSQTTYYSVAITATPRTTDGYAEVGPKNSEPATFYGIASIAIVSSDVFDSTQGFAYTVTADKTLSHDGSAYSFSTTVGQSTGSTYETTQRFQKTGTTSTSTASVDITQSGYYLLQAWGGDGGDGGDAKASAKSLLSTVKTSNRSGGSGGIGGKIYGFVYLEAGDRLTMTFGSGGDDGEFKEIGYHLNGTVERSYCISGTGGKGAGAAFISLQKNGSSTSEYLFIAGGGGGGGGALAAAEGYGGAKGATGYTPTRSGSTVFGTTLLSNISSYNGSNGGQGSGENSGTILSIENIRGGSAGTTGPNYGNPNYINKGLTDTETVCVGRIADMLVSESGVTTTEYSTNASAQLTYICTPETVAILNQFPSIETAGGFSRYFELENGTDGTPDIEMVIGGMNPARKTVETVGEETLVTYYDANDLMLASFTYKLTANAEGGTDYLVTDTKYYPSFTLNKNVTRGYTATSGFDLVMRLNPRDGFLGGNDVPFLAEGSDGHSCVSITQEDNVGYLSSDPAVEYANVAIDYDLAADFRVNDRTLILGDGDTTNDSVTVDELYSLTTDLTPADPAEAWKSEFVYLVKPTGTVYAPAETERVNISVSILPKTAVPQKALVVGSTAGLTETLPAMIYVRYHVTYTLTNMSHGGESSALTGNDYSTTLLAVDGYLQPPVSDSITYITVKVGGVEITDFTYDQSTGSLTVPADQIHAPIEIIAVAKEMEYTLHYIYFADGDTSGTEYTESYVAGATIDYSWLDAFSMPEKEGYVFAWEWDTEGGTPPTVMPGRDVWAIGSYTKKTFFLIINYLNTSGETVAPAYVEQLEYQESYSVASPTLDGLLPDSAVCNGQPLSDPFVIKGTMGNGDVTVNVTYLSQNNKLVILYLDRNDNEMAPRYEATLAENGSYAVTSPEVTGYSPDPALATVSGTMPGNGSTIVKVYYTPNRYRVTLEYLYADLAYAGPKPAGTESLAYDFTSATMEGGDTVTVVYDDIYGYNADTDRIGMSSPLAVGYEFKGWYAEPECLTPITESTVVKITSDSTLYARWEPMKFNATVIYDFVYDEGDFEPDWVTLGQDATHQGEFYYTQKQFYVTQDFRISLPSIVGYTAYSNYDSSPVAVTELLGTMPASNLVYYVTYAINVYTVTFTDLAGSYINYPVTPEDPAVFDTLWLTLQVKHGATPIYSANAPVHGYDPAEPLPIMESYSHIFRGWVDSNTGLHHSADEPLPAATGDVTFYAEYDAFENIALIANSSDVTQSYHHTLQSAVDKAFSYKSTTETSAPRIKLHRAGTADTVDLSLTDGGTVQVEDGSTGSYYIVLDLNGYKLTGNTVLLNVNNRKHLTVYDSVGTGEIYLHGSGDVTALTLQSGGYLRLGRNVTDAPYTVKLSVSSDSGTATAIQSAGSLYLYAAELTVTTPAGVSYGINAMGTGSYTALYNASILSEVSDGEAYGVYHAGPFYLYGQASITAQTTTGNAYGVYSTSSVYLNGLSEVIAETTEGAAYGIYATGSGSIQAQNFGATLSAESVNGNAYGIYSLGSCSLKQSSSTDPISVTAYSHTKDAYGIYGSSLTGSFCANITARAPLGNATGLESTGTNSVTYGTSIPYTLLAEGKTAVGLKNGYYTYLYGTCTVIGEERAVGAIVQNPSYSYIYLQLYSGGKLHAQTTSGEAIALLDSKLQVAYANVTGEILATAEDGNAYVLCNALVSGSPSGVVFKAETVSGNAYGYYSDDTVERTMTSTLTLQAISPEGNAFGAYVANSDTVNFALSATGKHAYGVYVADGAKLKLYTSASVSATGTATDGAAYGVYNRSSVEILNGTVSATAEANAYGVLNEGVIVGSGTSSLSVSAVSNTANAYGLYNRSGSVGTNTAADALGSGVFTATVNGESGIGYGLYAEAGSIYIRGTELYYKGSADAYARFGSGVVILVGFSEERCPDDDASHPGYYHLVAIEYTLTFVYRDPDGNVLNANYASYTYTTNTSYIYAPSHPSSPDPGYWVEWEAYDLSIPAEGTVKYVYSKYTPYTYTVYFYIQSDQTYYMPIDFNYRETVVAPTDIGTRAGYTFSGEWYTDSNYTDLYTFGTMPSQNLYLYAKWIPGTFTVTFVTNGGTAIAPITGTYGTSISVNTPSKPGYSFDGWYRDPELTNYYSWGIYSIPNQDLTLYAAWEVSYSLIVLGQPKAYTVELNVGLDLDGNGQNDVYTLEMQEGQLTPVEVLDYMMVSSLPQGTIGSSPYVFRGWADADGNLIDLASGVGSWGITPENGVIRLYAQLEAMPELSVSGDMLVDFADLSIFGGNQLELGDHKFDFAAYAGLSPNQFTETARLGLTYRALMGGMQTFYAMTDSTRNMHVTLTVYRMDGSTEIVYEDTISPISSENEPTMESLLQYQVYMNKGEVLKISAYEETTDDPDAKQSAVYCLMDLPAGYTEMDLMSSVMMHNAMDFMFYSIESGTVTLPVDPQAGYEEIEAWYWKENGIPAAPVTSIDQSIFNRPNAWDDMDGMAVLYLYPYIAGIVTPDSVWIGYIVADRHFNPSVFESELRTVTVRADGSVSFAFGSESGLIPGSVGALVFTSGLPAGATLSLIDFSGTYPEFYYFVVSQSQAGITEIPLSAFVSAGGGSSFGGACPAMMFNLSYRGATHSITSESVGLKMNGSDAGVSLSYTLVHPTEQSFGSMSLPYSDPLEGNVPIPSLANKGYGSDDRVVLAIKMTDASGNPIAFPASMRMEAVGGVIHSFGDFAIADIGYVRYCNGFSVQGYLHLDSLRYSGFDGYFVYEIIVLPAGSDLTNANIYGTDAHMEARYRLRVTAYEDPILSLDESKGSSAAGDSLTLSVNTDNGTAVALDIYLYQAVNGRMETTESCGTLFADHSMGDLGSLVPTDGSGFSTGELTLTLSQNAAPGVYYLLISHGNSYAVYALTVTADAGNGN